MNEPEGTFSCPMCGVGTPHGHTDEEVAFYRDNQVLFTPGRSVCANAVVAASTSHASPDAQDIGGHLFNAAYVRADIASRVARHGLVAAASPSDTSQGVSEAPAGFTLMYVSGFQPLMDALDRASRKGYMPDAMAEEWEAFDYRAALRSEPTGEQS